MKHSHHDHCEHEEVAYCGHCQVVYCRGCKREWSDCKRSYWPHTSVWGSVPCGTGSSATISSDITFTDGTTTSDLTGFGTCSHA